jgi:hypothetical protein
MSESKPKGKISSSKSFVEEHSRRDKKRSSTSDSKAAENSSSEFVGIEDSVFYQVLFNPEFSPEEKQKAVAKALVFTDDKEKSKERLREFTKFKEYLQFERKRMAQQIISLTDTEAFSQLQAVYQDINGALLDFENSISPLTEIVDAVYTLRMNGVTFDIFREIVDDREKEEAREKEREEIKEKLANINREVRELRTNNKLLESDRSFFGYGPIRAEAIEKMSANKIALSDYEAAIHKLELELEQNLASDLEAEASEFADEKAKLRKLLDISSVEHKRKQELLVKSAQDFVSTTESRVGEVLGHFDGMNSQIEKLGDANYSMREIYAILNDATKSALKENDEKRESLSGVPEGVSDIKKMEMERSKRDLENYISSLSQSSVDTTGVLADLTSSGHRIKSMKDGNEQQVSKTRALHTSGVAGVADQLSTVLQAVSAAALGESSEMARMSLARMNKTTRELSQKEVIRVALGSEEVNSDLSKALEDLEQYGDVIRTATNITRDGLAETQRLLGDLEDTANSVQHDVRESIGIAADVVSGRAKAAEGDSEEKSSSSDIPNPFGVG